MNADVSRKGVGEKDVLLRGKIRAFADELKIVGKEALSDFVLRRVGTWKDRLAHAETWHPAGAFGSEKTFESGLVFAD